MAGHEDREAVMITFEMVDLFRGAPTDQQRTGRFQRVELVEQLAGLTGWADELPAARSEPLVQPVEAVAAGVPGSSFGPAMYPSSIDI
jgi:hypothetical protein